MLSNHLKRTYKDLEILEDRMDSLILCAPSIPYNDPFVLLKADLAHWRRAAQAGNATLIEGRALLRMARQELRIEFWWHEVMTSMNGQGRRAA